MEQWVIHLAIPNHANMAPCHVALCEHHVALHERNAALPICRRHHVPLNYCHVE